MVRSGHGPQAEVAQGVWTSTSRGTRRKTSGRAGRRATERRGKRETGEEKQPQRNAQVHMHGWDDACKADLSHKCDVTRCASMKQRSVCSVLSVVHVHVRDSVLCCSSRLAQG